MKVSDSVMRVFVGLLEMFDIRLLRENDASMQNEETHKLCESIKQIMDTPERKEIGESYIAEINRRFNYALPTMEQIWEAVSVRYRISQNIDSTELSVFKFDYGFDFNLQLNSADGVHKDGSVVFTLTRGIERPPMIEISYFTVSDCPIPVCRLYTHPRAQHLTIPLNTLMKLVDIDERHFEAITMQTSSWDGIVEMRNTSIARAKRRQENQPFLDAVAKTLQQPSE
ncbi:MAG: hypothetical protein NTW50_00775 [Candidatus Berkelbacteria bacterium]|nr:hypothetical protein [Candidatus Berkelbacteria bacterium]